MQQDMELLANFLSRENVDVVIWKIITSCWYCIKISQARRKGWKQCSVNKIWFSAEVFESERGIFSSDEEKNQNYVTSMHKCRGTLPVMMVKKVMSTTFQVTTVITICTVTFTGLARIFLKQWCQKLSASITNAHHGVVTVPQSGAIFYNFSLLDQKYAVE